MCTLSGFILHFGLQSHSLCMQGSTSGQATLEKTRLPSREELYHIHIIDFVTIGTAIVSIIISALYCHYQCIVLSLSS